MARLRQSRAATAKRILVVDDDAEFATSTARLISREGHEVLVHNDPTTCLERVIAWRPNVLLLDYYMGRTTGEQVVNQIREIDQLTQVILVTGYASEQPARRLLADLDIQSFHDKADGPERLLVTLDAVLKHEAALTALERQRKLLRTIAAASPEVTGARHVPALAQTALGVLARVVDRHEVAAGVFATRSGFASLTQLHAIGMGTAASFDELPRAFREAVSEAWALEVPGTIRVAGPGGQAEFFAAVPVTGSYGDVARMLVAGELPDDALTACELLAQQVGQSWENIRLFEKATHDELTGINNRSYGMQRLREMLKLDARAREASTSVLMLDVDYFKKVNDRLGHAAGDQVIRDVAQRLRTICRESDVLLRYGGEEFALGLPFTTVDAALETAERLRRAIAERPVVFDGQGLEMTISIGVATARGGETTDEVVRRADAALYRAKAEGRNRVCVEEFPQEAER